jgi:hypothetical protein
MHGNTQQTVGPQQPARTRNRQTIVAQMNADAVQRQGNIDPVIDKELRSARMRQGLHFPRKRHEFSDREIALTDLNGGRCNRENSLE